MNERTAYVAGLFEAEGSIIRKAERSASIRIGMTDEDVVRRLPELAGCGKVYGPYIRPHRWKPIWLFATNRKPEACQIVTAMWPWLGERRRQRCTELLDGWESPSTTFVPTEAEAWAWAAGIYEGEGSLRVKPDLNSIEIGFTMTDGDVLSSFRERVRVGRVTGPFEPPSTKRKPLFKYYAGRQTEVRKLASGILPWLGVRRTGQFESALSRVQPGHYRQRQTHCVHGHPFDEANTYRLPNGNRHCKTCVRLANRKRQKKLRAAGFSIR